MNKLVLSGFLTASLFLASANALTVIDQNGRVHQTEQQQQKKKSPTRKDYYDSWGRNQGHSEKRPFSNRTDHYDSWGRNEGHSERTYSGEVRHYDNWGRYQGSTKDR